MKNRVSVSAVLLLLLGEATAVTPKNLAQKVSDHSFLDVDLGSKMSTLGLNILAKNKQTGADHAAVPNNEMISIPSQQLLQTGAWGRHRQSSHSLMQQDDLNDSEILAYSTLNTATDDEDSIFSSGGAIMDALE